MSEPERSTWTPAGPAGLISRLKGDLPCLGCRYNLRGLSIKGVCPECGTPVRATLLAAIDPYANVLRPIPRRRATAAGFTLWAAAALAAALLTWLMHASVLVEAFGVAGPRPDALARAAVLCILASGVGALALIRPHAGIPARQVAGAAVAVACYPLLAWLYWRVYASFDLGSVYLQTENALPERSAWRLLAACVLAAIIVGLRPNARLLAARSVLLREGRVDRQTLLAMVGVLGVGAAGDAVRVFADALGPGPHAVAVGAGTILIVVSSMLFTIGLIGVMVDVWRIRVVILQPAPSVGDMLGAGAAAEGPGS